jgi:hypothetical protein
MPLDGYSPCPCETGKKVKFCCPDLLDDLNKIERMIAGDQRLACLEYIEKLEATKPDRACLLAAKIEILSDLKRFDELRQVVLRFAEKHPENPVALAELALLKAVEESPHAGALLMQRALRACHESMPNQVYSALGTLARILLSAGQPLAAKAHFSLMMTIAPDDEFPVSMVMQLSGAEMLPVPLRDVARLHPCPQGVSWSEQFAQAAVQTQRAEWTEAEKSWTELAAGAGQDSAAVWHNLAVVRAWLADLPGAVEAQRRWAALDVPLDEAVEAEALAQLLDADGAEPPLEVVVVPYPIAEMERLMAVLSADRRAAQAPVEQQEPNATEPPARARFMLLDRARLESGVGVTAVDVPKVVCEILIFGRQTDREARVELEARRGEELDRARGLLAEIAGDSLGAPGEPEVIDGESPVSALLSARHYLPPDTPVEVQQELAATFARTAILERWTSCPLRLLDGKTPREAALDAKYRVRLLAAILLLEDMAARHMRGFDFNELRTSLGLPSADVIDPSTVELSSLPLTRLARLDFAKLSDDDLLSVYTHAMLTRYRPAMVQAAREVVSRTALDGRLDKAEALGVLAENAASSDEALAYYGRAAEEAVRAGTSPAQWYLAEVPLRLMREDVAGFERLIRILTTKHAAEPGVREALMQIMYSLGLVGPDGRPTQRGPELAAASTAPAAAAAEPGIWTPGAEAPQGGKSGLWLPGME